MQRTIIKHANFILIVWVASVKVVTTNKLILGETNKKEDFLSTVDLKAACYVDTAVRYIICTKPGCSNSIINSFSHAPLSYFSINQLQNPEN